MKLCLKNQGKNGVEKLRIGLPTTLFPDIRIEKVMEKLFKLGAECVEIVFEIPHFPPERREIEDLKGLKKILTQYGLPLSVHSCFYELNLGGVYYNVRSFTLNEVKKCLKFAGLIEADVVTVHSGYFPVYDDEVLRRKAMERFIEDIELCLKFSKEENVQLSLENIQSPYFLFSSLESAPEIFTRVEDLTVTLDIGHAYIIENSSGKKGKKGAEERIAEKIENILNKRIRHLHIHDNFGVKDDHLVPGDGEINFKPIIGALRRIGYNNQVIVEAWSPKKSMDTGIKALKRVKILFT